MEVGGGFDLNLLQFFESEDIKCCKKRHFCEVILYWIWVNKPAFTFICPRQDDTDKTNFVDQFELTD